MAPRLHRIQRRTLTQCRHRARRPRRATGAPGRAQVSAVSHVPDTRGVRGTSSVAAGGLGLRFKAQKYFGLTFGIDLAQGPDGLATYIQIGNAWAR